MPPPPPPQVTQAIKLNRPRCFALCMRVHGLSRALGKRGHVRCCRAAVAVAAAVAVTNLVAAYRRERERGDGAVA